MSWDIAVQAPPVGQESLDGIRPGLPPRTLGRRDAIIEAIKTVCPHADFSDPAWGVIQGAGHCLEVNLGDDESVTGFAFHVRGGVKSPRVVEDILKQLNLTGINCHTRDVFRVEGTELNYRRWLRYVQQVNGCWLR